MLDTGYWMLVLNWGGSVWVKQLSIVSWVRFSCLDPLESEDVDFSQ